MNRENNPAKRKNKRFEGHKQISDGSFAFVVFPFLPPCFSLSFRLLLSPTWSGSRIPKTRGESRRKKKGFWVSGTLPPCLLKISLWDDMEVPEESFHWSSWDSRTCYPRRAFIQGLTDDRKGEMERWQKEGIARAGKRKETKGKRRSRIKLAEYERIKIK